MEWYVLEHTYAFGWVEGERIAAGRWIHTNSRPDDVVPAAHGHVAPETRRYVVDATGLNSRIATQYGLDWDRLVTSVRPAWVVKHGLEERAEYRRRRSFYNSTLYGHPALRIYQREAPVSAREGGGGARSRSRPT